LKPDGYTILLAPSTNSLTPALYGKALGYDPVNAFACVAYVASVPLIVVGPMDGPKTLPELIGMLRMSPTAFLRLVGQWRLIHLAGFLLPACRREALHAPIAVPRRHDRYHRRPTAFQMDTLAPARASSTAARRVCLRWRPQRLRQPPDVPTVRSGAQFSSTHGVAQAFRRHAAPGHRQAERGVQPGVGKSWVTKRMDELAIEPIQSTPESTKYFDGQMAFWDPIVKASGPGGVGHAH
jgi:tripartite-type tricarboxylate transporter receptor subunit TctC